MTIIWLGVPLENSIKNNPFLVLKLGSSSFKNKLGLIMEVNMREERLEPLPGLSLSKKIPGEKIETYGILFKL